MNVQLHFDGASRGNPGSSGAGVWITSSKLPDVELSQPLGRQTNNYAEYMAVILGLKYIINLPEPISVLEIIGDSQLVLKQLAGEWKINSANLKPLHRDATQLIGKLEHKGVQVKFVHVPRAKNKKADEMANRGADQNQ